MKLFVNIAFMLTNVSGADDHSLLPAGELGEQK